MRVSVFVEIRAHDDLDLLLRVKEVDLLTDDKAALNQLSADIHEMIRRVDAETDK